jgi:argininosuccinate lyase
MEKFNESLSFDKRMWAQDLKGSMAFAKANVATGILTQRECDQIVQGLEQVYKEWESGTFVEKPGDEDIHTANERRLTELIGPLVGGKLHTGRSRNDQVATDTRLWTVSAEQDILQDLKTLLLAGADYCKIHVDVLMAGYTHLQPAQPIRFSHWVLSHLAPLVRDAQRLQDIIPRANQCPLGSGALAGNAFGIDRQFLANELHFDGVTSNSLDSVCDRDFVVEFLFWSTLLLTHLSQFAEDVIITNLLKGVDIDDAYATGSSLMPQKKNPYCAGPGRRIHGHPQGIATSVQQGPAGGQGPAVRGGRHRQGLLGDCHRRLGDAQAQPRHAPEGAVPRNARDRPCRLFSAKGCPVPRDAPHQRGVRPARRRAEGIDRRSHAGAAAGD